MRAYTEGLLSSDSNSRVGIILFSSSAQVEIPLDSTSSPQMLLQQIDTLRYIGSGTNTPDGLCLLKTMPWRQSASVLRVAVVLTDGRSTSTSDRCSGGFSFGSGTLSSTAAEVHNLQPPVTVFAVGVGNYDRTELNIIASSPLQVDELNSFRNSTSVNWHDTEWHSQYELSLTSQIHWFRRQGSDC